MVNHRYQGRCGSCRLSIKAVNASLDNGLLYRIEGDSERDIKLFKKDGETRFMHAADFERAGVGCIYTDGKMVGAYSERPLLCQHK